MTAEQRLFNLRAALASVANKSALARSKPATEMISALADIERSADLALEQDDKDAEADR